MEPNDSTKKKRKQLTSEDLKRRLYEKGMHGNSMPSLKSPLTTTDNKPTVLYVNLNSSVSKKESGNSPKILKKTASAFGSRSREQKGYFPNITTSEFMPKKKSSPFTNSPKAESPSSPAYKTSINFFQSKRKDSEPKEEIPQFNSSFYKVDSLTRNNETRMTKRLVEKMSGHKKEGGKNKFAEDELYRENSPPKQEQQKDEILENDDNNLNGEKEEEPFNIISNKSPPKHSHLQQHKEHHQSTLEDYISLILKNVPNVDEFLYLVRHRSPESQPEQENIYQLEIIDYQEIKQKDKDPNFEYYTISKKGFCHYFGGKPIEFIDLKEWLEEKEIYEKIKKLKFFSRFRRWKTIKMWIKKVVRHRFEKCSLALEDKLFILNPTIRLCILEINKINLEMEKSLCIISKNEGTYTLESFKHCQEKTRRESASIVEEFSRRSRQSVRRCFDENLENLKELLKTRANFEDKNFAASTHNPKDNAFQVLGFPAKMSYEHRSKLRKLTGRFVRFSYLIDFIHLNGLAGIFKTQIESFSSKLNKLQIESEAEVICSKEKSKLILEENDRERMFSIQMIFKPYEISEAYINEIPLENFDISMQIEKASESFNPLYHIREKVPEIMEDATTQNHPKMHLIKQESIKEPEYRKFIPSICDLWLSMKPTLDNIFDELSFLIKESMASLKYFERWSKHREMQKYINILEEWDDIVSENWEVCENDNLDPISIIENLESSMSRIKEMLQISENKLTEKIVDNTTEALNIYWENTQADIEQLLTNPNIENNAETIEYYLAYMSQWIEKFESKIPNLIELGIFTVNLDKMKYQVIEFMKQTCENFKNKLPQYVEDNTNELNVWLSEKAQLLREEIHNIDDFVKLNKSLKIIDDEFHHKKELCNDLGHIYQTMYNYKIESKKRKEFESITLKAKDQLEQLLIHVEQNIERKTEFFTREVSRYHLPNLLKEIEKISDNIGSEEFESLKSSSENVIKKLIDIKKQYGSLKEKKAKCLEYLTVLKLSEVDVTELDELERQINARLEMWENMDIFSDFMKKIDSEIVSEMDLEAQKEFVTEKRQIVKSIESIHNKPQNEVLRLLKSKVEKYFINLPLLQGFNDRLSDSHWEEIDEIVKEYPYLDLKKKEFTLKEFLETGIGKEAKRIEYIFNKAKVENELQVMYSEVENVWTNTLVKSKTESKFVIISNPEVMREAFDYMLRTLCTILSNPFSQTLRQYSLTYDTLIQHYNTFEHWMTTQEHLLKVDSMCRLFDVKKLPDYNQFENSEKIYKNVMKLFIGNRSVENGIKMNKLFVVGVDDRLVEMDEGLKKVEDNIKSILEEHRKNYPPYYIFTDDQLFNIITTPSNHQTIESTALKLIPSLSKLEFENERITGIYNLDNEKLQRNTISISLDVEQIIEQLSDTVVDNVRKVMRSCKYKAVEMSLIKLVPMFHCQYLLATNKIDFTNYTEISIENQSHTPESLKEFYKVMKKDIIEDLRLRNTIKNEFMQRYDALLLQSLYHEEVLGKLIKSNIKETTDYEWQKLLRFYWDETSGSSNNSNDDNNITVRQCHARIKYGNEYIGSRTKVIIECESKFLYALSQQETAMMKQSAVYQLERVMNFIGQRVTVFECDHFVKPIEVTNYLISCWYWQTASVFKNFDLLSEKVREELFGKNAFYSVKETLLKKNLFNIKESDKKPPAIFLSASNENVVHEFRSQFRTVTHSIMPHSHIKNLLRVKDVFEQENEISMFMMKLFELLEYLEPNSLSYNLSIEDFLENRLKLLTSGINKHVIFNEFLEYIKPKIGSETMAIMKETVRLEMVAVGMDELESIGSCANLNNVNILSKEKERNTLTAPVNKRSSSRPSQQNLLINTNKLLATDIIDRNQRQSITTNKNLLPKSTTTTTTTSKQPRLSKLPLIEIPTLEDIKKKELKEALEYRRMIVLTGKGVSKMHLLKNAYKKTHRIIEVFSELESEELVKEGLISHYLKKLSMLPSNNNNKNNNNNNRLSSSLTEQNQQHQETNNTILYFNTLTIEILTEMEMICHNIKYLEVKKLLEEKNVLIVIGVEKLPQNVDYGLVSWLYVVNVELEVGYLLEVGKEWAERYLEWGIVVEKAEQEKQLIQAQKSPQPTQCEQFIKFYQETLLTTFDNWSIKDIKLRERYIYMFLTYLQSLLPVKKLLEAMVYCFIRLFSNLDADYIKLEFLVKKLIGEDKLSEDERVYELVYYKSESQNKDGDDSEEVKNEQKLEKEHMKQQQQYKLIPSNYEGLVNSKELYYTYCESLSQGYHSNNYNEYITEAYLHEHITTHISYHYVTIMNRILTKTSAGIFLAGPTNSGKTTLYEIFKRINYGNRSFLKLTMLDCNNVNKKKFLEKILGNVDVWGLSEIKGKVNYERSVVMVDDVSLDCFGGGNKSGGDNFVSDKSNETSYMNKEQLVTKINTQKLTLIKQLLQYKLLEYPTIKTPSLTAFQNSMLTLSNIDFILAGTHHPEQFTHSTIPIELTLNEQELKSIFNQYLRQRLTYFEINDLAIGDIVSTTFDICKKLSVKNTEFDGLEIVVAKCILGKFELLRIKDVSGNINKEVEKYWVYLLQEHLGMYDNVVPGEGNGSDNKKLLTTTELQSQQQPQKKKEKSVIYKELRNLNLEEIKPHTLCYTFLHTRSSPETLQSNEFSKKVEFVKDIKKIFNVINEKIEKYNDSENKRYGGMFEYIHFDELVKKVVKLANNLITKDYLLLGRKGSGKESLVKLVAYLQGSNYRPVNEESHESMPPNQESPSLKQTITNIFLNSNITTMSSFILTKHLLNEKDIQQLEEYYYCDFENEILNNKELDKPQKVYIKEKEREREREREREKEKERETKMLNTSTNSRMAQRTFGNINTIGFSTTPEYYIPPRQKLSLEDVTRYKEAIRVVILCNDRELVSNLPLKIKHELMLDELEEIPISSMQEYTVKFLEAEQTKCSPKISLLLAQIWNFAKDELELTLRDYDDSVRLFCSFVDTLTEEIQEELTKYGRVISLYDSLKKLTSSLEREVEQLHEQIKILTEQIATEAQESEEKKQQKHSIEEEMHKKSTYLNKSEKIIEMFDLLIPYFKEKHSIIQRYVMDREYFEESLAVGSCYFTFMSEMTMVERRKMLEKWYGNVENVPLLQSSEMIQSFLTMFNLYPEEFNTEPIDDLEDFYENMAIVFNSVKPVFIKDTSHRGKHWLENVCSFVCVSEKESNFIEVICENLIKPSNILIEITSQETMNNLSSSFIHSLLFLSDTTDTVNIKGVEYKVSPEAKFYVLLNENIELSEEQKREFTIVKFSESMELLQKQLEYAMMSNCHADVFYSQLEMKKKIRNLKLEKEALMLEIAENMYSAYEGVVGGGVKSKNESEENSEGEEEKMETEEGKVNKGDKSKEKDDTKDKNKKLTEILIPTTGQLEQFISELTDKTLTRGQNLSNKLKEKQELCKDIESKLSFTVKYTSEIKLFVETCIEVYEILKFMQEKGLHAHNNEFTYCEVTHVEFVKRITMGIKRKFIKVEKVRTVLLFAIKLWGDQYVERDFYVYLMAILTMNNKLEGKVEFKLLEEKSRRNLYEQKEKQKGQGTSNKITTTRTILEQEKEQEEQCNFHSKNNIMTKHSLSTPTLTPSLLQTITSSTSYEQLTHQLNEQFVEFLSKSFTHDLLTPYYQNKGTIHNLLSNSNGDDIGSGGGDGSNMMRYIVLNNVWVLGNNVNSDGKKMKDVASVTGANNTTSLAHQQEQLHQQQSHFLEQKLESENMKIVKLEIKSFNNLEHEIKRYIFEENILMISSLELLETTLEHLYKLGSHEKVIYFNLPICQYHINKVMKLVKKYQIREVNNIYERRNKLLEESLFRLERERESKKLSSVRDIINSDKSIGRGVGLDDDDGEGGGVQYYQQHQQYYDYDNNNNNNNDKNINIEKRPSTIGKSVNSKEEQKLEEEQKTISNDLLTSEQSQSIQQSIQHSTTQHKKTFTIRSEKNLLEIEREEEKHRLSQIITVTYNILELEYLRHNLKRLYMSNEEQEIDHLSDYVMTCVYSDEQREEFTLKEKVLLVLKVMETFVKEDSQSIDEVIGRRLGDIKSVVMEECLLLETGNNNIKSKNNNELSEKQYEKLETALRELEEDLEKEINSECSLLLTNVAKKATKLQFESEHVNYIMRYFSFNGNHNNSEKLSTTLSIKDENLSLAAVKTSIDIEGLVTKAKNIFEVIRNIDEPIAVKRNSRKSVNAIFRKEELREKLLSSQQALGVNVVGGNSFNNNLTQQQQQQSSTTTTTMLQKKPAINIKRGSKQSFLSTPPANQLQQQNQQQQQQNLLLFLTEQQHYTNLAPIMLEIEYKKLSSKINYLIKKIEHAIQTVYERLESIELLLVLLEDAIPGTWVMILGQRTFNVMNSSLESLFKKYIRLQEDMSYCLERIKRNTHSEIDFTYVRFPKDYLQLYFRKRLNEKMTMIGSGGNNEQQSMMAMGNTNNNNNTNNTIFILMNNPTNEELDNNSEDHVKIASIQCSGWRFSPTEANVIDAITAGDKPSSSEAKLSQSCCLIKKNINTVNLNNLVPIDVYESKESTKPFMKVYAVCKKVTSTNNSLMGNNLLMYLKESIDM